MDTQISQLFESSLKANWDREAFSDYQGNTHTYKQVSQEIIRFHRLLQEANIQQGAKIILLGRNSSNWAISYIALITYGIVLVPVLPDFKTDDFHHIINHSDAEAMFISETIYKQLDKEQIPNIKLSVSLDTFQIIEDRTSKNLITVLKEIDESGTLDALEQESIHFSDIDNHKLALLSYTSGTTGFSKGVMISRNNLISNITFAIDHMPLQAGNKICSFLPMAHIYGQLFEFLFPFSVGCHITFLNKMPSPTVLTKAFGEIKPDLILSVPLIIEKIYKKRLVPVLSKPGIKILLSIPGINKLLYRKINQQLTNTFGGNFYEMVVGGAAINKNVEAFFTKIKLRFTVGYGMTECAPLISYESWNKTKINSAGKIVDRMQVRIDSSDPFNIIGEIQVKGDNVMMGYYKDEKSTKASFTKDGWLKTGDLGIIDKNNFIFLKGRSKNMLLGANGKNIYPEEIEAKINHLPIVLECVVVYRDDKLVALINPDPDYIKTEGLKGEGISKALNEACKSINKSLPAFMRLARFELHETEFEKTPKKSIKRYLYS